MNTPIQSSAPHAYPFKPENTKRGYGAIDIVVNIYTPEAIAENRIPTDANFIDKVRLNSAYSNGVTMEQYLEKMNRAGIERSLLIATRCGDLRVRGSTEYPMSGWPRYVPNTPIVFLAWPAWTRPGALRV